MMVICFDNHYPRYFFLYQTIIGYGIPTISKSSMKDGRNLDNVKLCSMDTSIIKPSLCRTCVPGPMSNNTYVFFLDLQHLGVSCLC